MLLPANVGRSEANWETRVWQPVLVRPLAGSYSPIHFSYLSSHVDQLIAKMLTLTLPLSS